VDSASLADEYDVDWDEHPQAVKAAHSKVDADLTADENKDEIPLVVQKHKGGGGVRRSLIRHDTPLLDFQAQLGYILISILLHLFLQFKF
jgi:hypothetical protein